MKQTRFYYDHYIGTQQKELSGSTVTKGPNSPSAMQVAPAGSFENATMTEQPAAGRIAFSLDVVCCICLDELSIPNCIRSAGFCKDPSHIKVRTVLSLIFWLSNCLAPA